VSDVVREMLREQLEERRRAEADDLTRYLEALERIKKHREAILARRGGKPFEMDAAEGMKTLRVLPGYAFSRDGKEIFLSFDDSQDSLFGLLRLRLERGQALVRELHVYGPEVPLGEKSPTSPQHRGLGRALLQEAEGLAAQAGAQELRILSGVGAREYYRGLGYRLQGPYMVRALPALASGRLPGRAS